MSGPYSAGRDDNVGSGFGFAPEPDVADVAGEDLMAGFAEHATGSNLSEVDYRDAENKP